jgi:hypothetical protein
MSIKDRLKWEQTLTIWEQKRLQRLGLSLEVGHCKPSVILQSSVLYADKFPTFHAQNVQVILNILNDWLFSTFKITRVNLCLNRNNQVFPLHQFESHVTTFPLQFTNVIVFINKLFLLGFPILDSGHIISFANGQVTTSPSLAISILNVFPHSKYFNANFFKV